MRISRLAALTAGLSVLLGAATAATVPAAAVAQPPDPALLVPAANFGSAAIVSSRLAWAVGNLTIGDINSADVSFKPLIMRWNGAAWAQVPSPAPATGGDLLQVAATSAGNAWAVGHSGGTPGVPSRALIEHWDGTTWKTVPSPHPGGSSILVSVAAVSARSAWAVGTISQHNETCPCRALIEHWDGTAWKQAARLHQAGIVLSAVAADSARSAWAVGDLSDKHGNHLHAVIEHWNGAGWKKVPSPDAKPISLNGVAAVSARSAWAVGSVDQRNGSDCRCRAVIEHWNGSAWKRMPSHAPAGSNLFGVSPVSGHDAWAVGYSNFGKSLIEHWNGTVWRRVPSATSPRSQTLSDVAASSAGNAWAVGISNAGGNDGSGLILHWDGAHWR